MRTRAMVPAGEPPAHHHEPVHVGRLQVRPAQGQLLPLDVLLDQDIQRRPTRASSARSVMGIWRRSTSALRALGDLLRDPARPCRYAGVSSSREYVKAPSQSSRAFSWKSQELREIRVGLTGEADEEGGADDGAGAAGRGSRKSGRGCAAHLRVRPMARRIFGRGMLERKVEVRQETRVAGHEVEESAREVIGVDVEHPHPEIPRRRDDGGRSRGSSPLPRSLPKEPRSWAIRMSSRDPAVPQPADLLDDHPPGPAGKVSADQRDGAVRAAVRAALRDLHVGAPREGQQVRALVRAAAAGHGPRRAAAGRPRRAPTMRAGSLLPRKPSISGSSRHSSSP